jgi:hypothetical protein
MTNTLVRLFDYVIDPSQISTAFIVFPGEDDVDEVVTTHIHLRNDELFWEGEEALAVWKWLNTRLVGESVPVAESPTQAIAYLFECSKKHKPDSAMSDESWTLPEMDA